MPEAVFTPEPFGPYLLLAHLGRGGMADVFKARVEGVAGFARSVVVKRILRIHTDDPHFVDLFINEAKIAARLSHPNIAQVYERGQVNGELFMAMEYIRGLDLLRLLRGAAEKTGEAALPPLVVAYIGREVCRGLAHAHEHVDENGAPRPIIHRDISPQNIMIGFDGQVKVVDFGIAKAVTAFHEATMTGSLKGKFGYMAPEQIDTGLCTPQTDVFSAGVTLHEVLTGRRLFKGQTDFDTMNRVKTAPVPAPSQINPSVAARCGLDLAQGLDRVVLTALQRDPAQRYPRAGQMARDLDRILHDAHFGVEDLVAWLRHVIPVQQRDDHESQVLALGGGPGGLQSRGSPSATGSPIISVSGTGPTRPGPGRTPTPLGGALGTRPGTTAAAPDPGKRVLAALLTGGVIFVISMVGVTAYLRSRSRPVVQRPGPPVAALRQPEPPPPVTPRPPVPAAPVGKAARVLLISEPPGAKVYGDGGALLLGSTPLTVSLSGESREVRLIYEGRPELRYTLRSDMGPEVTLRLEGRSRRHGHGGKGADADLRAATTPGSPASAGGKATPPGPSETPAAPVRKKLKIDAIDDEDGESRKGPKALE